MKNFRLILLFLTLLVTLCSCEKDGFNTSSDFRLDFSDHILSFDTLFTGISSTTLHIKAYNRSSQSVHIKKAGLANPETSPFRLNINGNTANSLEDFELKANDSLYIFVELMINPENSNLPRIIEDFILFEFNQTQQSVKLVAWGQDAHFIDNETLTTQTWTADRPYLLSGTVWVDTLQTLTLEPGVRVYFQKNAGLHIKGKIKAYGGWQDPILFANSRLEDSYKNIPGQWEGLFFYQGSDGNILHNIVLINAIQGINMDSGGFGDQNLEISNSRLNNFTTIGIRAKNANIIGDNLLILDCGKQALLLEEGGNYEFYHSTIANYWTFSFRDVTTVEIQDTPQKVHFGNSIIYGNNRKELELGDDVNKASLNFTNCLIQLGQSESLNASYFNNCIFDEDPQFINIQTFNFHLTEQSPAINKGDIEIGNSYPFDLDGNNRTLDTYPDIGSFEFIQE